MCSQVLHLLYSGAKINLNSPVSATGGCEVTCGTPVFFGKKIIPCDSSRSKCIFIGNPECRTWAFICFLNTSAYRGPSPSAQHCCVLISAGKVLNKVLDRKLMASILTAITLCPLTNRTVIACTHLSRTRSSDCAFLVVWGNTKSSQWKIEQGE